MTQNEIKGTNLGDKTDESMEITRRGSSSVMLETRRNKIVLLQQNSKLLY